VRLEHHVFRDADLVGGDPAIDLVNTVTARDSEPRDWLDDYEALLRWARLTGRFARKDLAQLEERAGREPARARAALGRGKAVREALCGALYSIVDGKAPARADLVALEKARQVAVGAARLAAGDGRIREEWTVDRSGLDLVTHVVTVAGLELLRDPRVDRLRRCDGSDCGWVFLDTSKAGRRRWCDMATCGNVAKARRHYQRHSSD
jgi:predicted RNA-binding Zn ribbon-like protein